MKTTKDMSNANLDHIINFAKKTKSYFITATVRDKTKTDGDLTHHIVQEDFPVDDIIPSIDACLQSMDIKPTKTTNIVKPSKVYEKRQPLKIAILTHFNRAPQSYSPARAVRNQVKMLRKFGHEVVFFTQEGSILDKEAMGCEVRNVVPKFKREKNVVNEEIKNKFIDVLRNELTSDFDLAITHDFYIDDCITYREAVKECGVPIKWLHWARSGVGRAIDFKMDNARYVYMNIADTERFARAIGVDHKLIRVTFNEKDPALLFNWDPVTSMVNEKMRLWEKDVIQIYPICTTRMDAKGINSVIKIFGALKELGNNVALVICNANGRRRVDEIKNKMEFAETCGLTEKDIVFTSTLSTDELKTESEVTNRVVTELLQLSNLFIFPTIAEVCSNVLLEASMTKNLLVLNEDVPSLFDFAGDNAVLSHKFTSLQSIHYSGGDEGPIQQLAKQINGQLKSNKADLQFRKVWRTHCLESVYREQLEPILYE